jgi:hypothetical protein
MNVSFLIETACHRHCLETVLFCHTLQMVKSPLAAVRGGGMERGWAGDATLTYEVALIFLIWERCSPSLWPLTISVDPKM